MSTQRSVPYPETESSPPGIALVRRLNAPPPFRPAPWERTLLRLCLYPLPAIWALLLRAAWRATGTHPLASPANVQFVLVLCFAWIAAIECLDAASCKRINREHTGLMAVLASVCVASGAAALLLALLGIALPGLLQCATDGAFLLTASAIIILSFRAIFNTQSPLTRIAIVDMHIQAGDVSWTLTRKRVSRHNISGAIRLEAVGKPRPVMNAYSLDELVRELQREPLEGVLISAPSAEVSVLSQRIGACGSVGAPVRFVTGSSDCVQPHQSLSTANCLYLLNIGAAPTKTLNYSIFKRGFDLIFSLAAILAGLPLIALIALAIKFSSKGSIFFVQDRVGWNGKVFRMYKFRTMHTAPPSESDTRWSQQDDARRTSLRRASSCWDQRVSLSLGGAVCMVRNLYIRNTFPFHPTRSWTKNILPFELNLIANAISAIRGSPARIAASEKIKSKPLLKIE